MDNDFLVTLLNLVQRKTATEEVVRGAWHLAVRSKNIDAMAIIAGSEVIPEDVLAAVKARNEIDVAVAYLTRDNVSAEERKTRLEAEQRAGVLAGVLQSKNVTDEDRQVLSGKLIAKPTVALAEAVIVDLTMPLASVVVAIELLDKRTDNLTESQRNGIRRQIDRCAVDADSAAKVAKVINRGNHAEAFLCRQPVLGAEDFKEIFDRAIVPMLQDSISKNRVNHYRIISTVRGIIGESGVYHSEIVLDALRNLLEPDDLSKVWTEVVGATRAVADTSEQSDHSVKVLTARESTDSALLDGLTEEALNGNAALIEPLLRNMHLSVESMLRIVASVDQRTIARLPELRPGDKVAALQAYLHCFDRAVHSDRWKSFPDRRAAEELILAFHCKMWEEGGSSYYGSASSALSSVITEIHHNDLLGELPWQFVASVTNRYGSDKVSRFVANMQSEMLGSDMKKWETAEVLSNGFTGTIRELFQAAATL